MGMPVTIEVVDPTSAATLEMVFDYFRTVDERFSTYKSTSEISKINRGEIMESEYSREMREVFALAEEMKIRTDGYFEIRTPTGSYDPSGIVKGWAIRKAAKLLREQGYQNFYVEAGGDIQTAGHSKNGEPWKVGIRNPFNDTEIINTVILSSAAIATSGTYIRGRHIYNPKTGREASNEIVSISVVGTDIYEADSYATAAFAMGREGINLIETIPGLEGYMIDANGIATETSGFEKYVLESI